MGGTSTPLSLADEFEQFRQGQSSSQPADLTAEFEAFRASQKQPASPQPSSKPWYAGGTSTPTAHPEASSYRYARYANWRSKEGFEDPENEVEFRSPEERDIYRKAYEQPEPPELAAARKTSEEAEANRGFWNRHFGSPPAETLAYDQLSEKYKNQLQDQVDTQRYLQAKQGGTHLQELAQINRERAQHALARAYGEELFKPSNMAKFAIESISPVGDPVEASGIKGPYHFGKGLYQTATAPTQEERYRHATEAVGGIAESLNPLLYTEAGIRPSNIIKYTLGQKFAGGAGQLIAEKLGASPELQNFVEATSGLLGGVGLGFHERLSGTAKIKAGQNFIKQNADLVNQAYEGNQEFKDAIDKQDWNKAAQVLRPLLDERIQLKAKIEQAEQEKAQPEGDTGLTRGELPKRYTPIQLAEEFENFRQEEGKKAEEPAPQPKPQERFKLSQGQAAAEVPGPVKGYYISTIKLDNGKTIGFDRRRTSAEQVSNAALNGELWKLTGEKPPAEATARAEQEVRGEPPAAPKAAQGEAAVSAIGEENRVTEGRAQNIAEEFEKFRSERAAPQPGEVGTVKTNDLTLAPKRFQYKLRPNEQGVTGQFVGSKFNPELAGVVSVWRDPADGKLYVVNGHHRLELAQRSDEQNVNVRHIVAANAEEARTMGALQNIADGRGTATDAGKLFRDTGMKPEELEKKGISLTEGKIADGLALSKLNDFLFEKVATGELTEQRGIAIGEATADPAQQEAIYKLLEKQEAKGRKVTNDTVSELARFVSNSGNKTVEQGGLFGRNQEIHSLALEKAEISAYIKQQIAKEKRAFAAVATSERAQTLGRVEGQQIKPEENKQISDAARQAEEVYNRLSSRTGPVNDILEKAARDQASGNYKPEDIRRIAYQSIRAELHKALAGSEGQGAGRPGRTSQGEPTRPAEAPVYSIEDERSGRGTGGKVLSDRFANVIEFKPREQTYKTRTQGEVRGRILEFKRKDKNTATADLQTALRSFEQAQSLEAEHPTAAAEIYRDIAAKNVDLPTTVSSHINLGTLLYNEGQFDRAIVHYEEAIKLDPESALAHFDMGNALEENGNRQAAIEHYERAASASPSWSDPRYNLARLHEQSGNPGKALTWYGEFLKRESSGPFAELAHRAIDRIKSFNKLRIVEPPPAAPESTRLEKIKQLFTRKKSSELPVDEGQLPLFNLSRDELLSWAKSAGSRIQVEEMGDQQGLFGGNEKMFRLSTSKQNSVTATESQLKELAKDVPALRKKLEAQDIMADDSVRFDYQPPEAATLFGAQKPPILTISRGARDLINEVTGFKTPFLGTNLSVPNIRVIAAQLAGDMEPSGEIPSGRKLEAYQLAQAMRQAAEEAGYSGITIHKENAPQFTVEEEQFHSGQRQLGRGEVREHLAADAIDRLLQHPVATKMDEYLLLQGYSPDLPKEFQVAEFAAHIATGQHSLSPEQAADWFINYVDELHKEHGEGNVASAFANMYDQARDLYEQSRQELEARAAGQRGSESERQFSAGAAPEHPTGAAPPEAGRRNRQAAEGRQGSLEQPFLLSAEREKERGSSTLAALPIPALLSSAKWVVDKGANWYHGKIDQLLNFVHLGDTRPEIRKYDEGAADLATKMDAGSQYHKKFSEYIARKVTGPLTEPFEKSDNYAERQKKNEVTRDRMKGFFFLADAGNRAWAEEHHPEDLSRWEGDPKIAQAIAAYRPFEEQLRQAVKQLGGKTIDEAYIKRILDFATSGIAYEKEGLLSRVTVREGKSGQAGAGRDNLVSPQVDKSKARKDEGQFYWDHGVFDFGPSFEKRWVQVMSKLDEHRLAVHAMSMGTRIAVGEEAPEKIFYNGQEFYRPDIAQEIREIQKRGVPSESKELADALGVDELPAPKNVKEYGTYQPLARGSRFENATTNLAKRMLTGESEDLRGQASNLYRMSQLKYAMPKEIVEALNDAGREKEAGAWTKIVNRTIAPITQFIRQQIVGLAYGVPHMANILRKVMQVHAGGALNPMAWADAFKVAFSKELKARAISGPGDEGFDRLLRNAGISDAAIPDYKHYIEGNFDVRSWEGVKEASKTVAAAFRKGGRQGGEVTPLSLATGMARLPMEALNRVSEAGHRNLFKQGGIDQRARLWLHDFLRDRYPRISDNKVADTVNMVLGRYNRASWTDMQKGLAPFMLFPGWDYSSIRYALRHPFKVAVAPAVIMFLANSAVRSLGGQQKDDEKRDTGGVHIGNYRVRTNLINDNMGSHLWGWALRGAESILGRKSAKETVGGVVKGLPGDVAGVTTGTLNPLISIPITVGANRMRSGSETEIAPPQDFKKRGRFLPNKAAEDYADYGARRVFPIYDRVNPEQRQASVGSRIFRGAAGLTGTTITEKSHRRRR